MYCENCGHKINTEQFCQNCDQEFTYLKTENNHRDMPQDRWWVRLTRVIYIALYIPLPFVLFDVWTTNDPYSYYSTYSGWYYSGSYSEAFWYSILTLIIWVVILRLVKIAVLYVLKGQTPKWKKEFKKFF